MGYTSAWSGKKDEILAIAEEVKQQHPDDFAIAHKRNPDGSEVEGNDIYIRRVAHEVNKVYVDAGLNGKRGDVNNISRDVLAFPNPAGCKDGSGKYLGLELADIIISAGTPEAHLGWADVTQDTINGGAIGAWVEPKEVEDGPDTIVVVPPFPPRNETVAFTEVLNAEYKAAGRKKIPNWFVDVEGVGVWVSEYLRRRQLGEGHDEATQNVLDDAHAAGLEQPQAKPVSKKKEEEVPEEDASEGDTD